MRWYRAAPGAKDMPFASRFGSLNWDGAPWTREGVGEVWSAYPNQWSAGATPPTSKGIAPFGTAQQFQEGATYDPMGFTLRDPWGLAVSCAGSALGGQLEGGSTIEGGGIDPKERFLRGGLKLGGKISFEFLERPGGLELGANAAVLPAKRFDGGLQLGGSFEMLVPLVFEGGLLLD